MILRKSRFFVKSEYFLAIINTALLTDHSCYCKKESIEMYLEKRRYPYNTHMINCCKYDHKKSY